MARSPRSRPAPGGGGEPGRRPLISRRGWRIISAGAALAALGFVILFFADARGVNWASKVSPFLILGGYAAVGAGIIARDTKA